MATLQFGQLVLTENRIGKGAFGVVLQALHKKDGQVYAVKIVGSLSAQTEEVTIHRSLNHPNIIKLIDVSTLEEGLLAIVLQYAQNGSLFNFQTKHGQFSEEDGFRFFYGTAKAVEYLHINNIIHRDVKPENILLDRQLNPKLCDFGWAAMDIQAPRKTFCGTYEYMAPQMLSQSVYDYRVDLWSLGVLLFQILHGFAPYKGKSRRQVLQSLNRLGSFVPCKKNLSPEVTQLIKGLLRARVEERFQMKDVMKSKWVFQNMRKVNLKKKIGHRYRNSINCQELKLNKASSIKELDIEKPQLQSKAAPGLKKKKSESKLKRPNKFTLSCKKICFNSLSPQNGIS